ncbi:MAG: peroxiredoxin [Candidatus Dormibacteraeota bacterium]|uniref:thioredoxin-dependent peroxiredoxin n=1 Tax=Candidatus Aeolococcus gillhamiae TaxID=3127015 RepID=A0A2W5YZW6_9BACT|nr:peroxiredoxin [Candidatus Dormibacteraeota bacterium]PZR78512.1 MAG: peroxiredoxin [Candidatus Dormibacter sp. RRmetagenome_bin12]
MALLTVGDPAPDITARSRDGTTLTLSSLRGRHVLVYFYPKDDTPGCTAEACGLNDNLTALSESGADVIGVSTDSWESHQRFAEKYGLKFALASDRDKSIRKAYGVGKMLGILPAVQRVSFLVGPDGRIVHVWPKVEAARHAADVLQEVRSQRAA